MTENSARKWRELARKKGEATELTLPSGMKIKAKRPNVGAWLRQGRLPKHLTQTMLKAAQAGSGREGMQSFLTSLQPEQFDDVLKFMRDLVVETVVEPRIDANATHDSTDAIHPGDVPDEDYDFIVEWTLKGTVDMKGGGQLAAEELSDFPGDAGGAPAGQNSGEVRAEAVAAGGD